jgi:23S rRNA (adenine2503-C2)-methyltransferase
MDVLEEVKTKHSLFGLTTGEIRSLLAEVCGVPAYRGSQVAEWLYRRMLPEQGGGFSAEFAAMTNLPGSVREALAENFSGPPLVLVQKQMDSRDGTIKALAKLVDGGHPIECVLLPDEKRVSVCLSTQAGCPMACAFCATGTQGLTRNLTTAEIVSQFLLLQSLSPRRITHIVLMGMGEPLLNYDATLKAIRILNAECGIAMRHITLSTVGIVPNIDKLAEENLQLTLAVSLHAPNDALRTRLVPVNKTYPLERLMASCRRYAEQTGRRLTFEYVLLAGVNDEPQHARELAQLLRGTSAAVNVIPYNPTSVAEPFERPDTGRIIAFRRILEDAGVVVTQRKERGRQIAAACGQLVTDSERRRPSSRPLTVLSQPILSEPVLTGAA